MVCLYNGILLVNKKKWIIETPKTWVNLKLIKLRERSQPEQQHVLYDSIYLKLATIENANFTSESRTMGTWE